MTTPERLERGLPTILADLAMGPTPDYLDDVFAETGRMRQRPRWTFPERWLPVADITNPTAVAPRIPLRAIGVALLIIAMLIAGALFVGSRQTRLPAPFGPAANGLLVFDTGGDIIAIDPATDVVTTLIAGPETDASPIFSPDGTRIAFERRHDVGVQTAFDVVVAMADGSDPVVVTPEPIETGPELVQWHPDGRSLLIELPGDASIRLFDAAGEAPPRVIASDAETYPSPFQPPNGSAILILRSTAEGAALVRLDLDTQDETVLATGRPDEGFGAARWSPDGSMVVYETAPADDLESRRLFLVSADGTGTRQVTDAPGTWFDISPSWSPDGTRIAFTRYERLGADWLVRPIGILSVADDSVIDIGPLPRDSRAQQPNPGDGSASDGEGFDFEWSPDGSSLIALPGEGSAHPVVIDIQAGTWRNLAPVVEPASTRQSWQRQAL